MDQVQDLTEAVQALRESTDILRREMRWRTRIAVIATVVLAAGVLGVWQTQATTSRQIAEADRRWCPMVSLLIPSRAEEEPTTDRGKQIVAQARTLSHSFGCVVD